MNDKSPTFKRLVDATRKNILRNKTLSFASTMVIMLTFLIAITFIGLVIISGRTVNAFEKKAQVIVFFHNDTPEEKIFEVQGLLENTGLLESIEYRSKEDALVDYAQDFEDDPTLVEPVTADSLPPSLGLRANDIDDIPDIIKQCNSLMEKYPEIEDLMYFQDVIDNLRSVSSVIKIGGVALTFALSVISVVLILITIGFNINAHKREIEVMQLIGSTDSYIRIPFLMEGTFYGVVGSSIAIVLLLTLWYGSIYMMKGSDMFFFISQTFRDINMLYLKEIDLIFITIAILSVVTVGATIGFISSSIATWKYLRK